jgi:nicotinate-nucleotide adenylyltransferase
MIEGVISFKGEGSGRRVGLFGGTFNPIHLGHLRGAEEVREHGGLDEVIFIPAALPPHKNTRHILEGHHRLEMVRLATKSNPHFSVSAVELERPGKSFSIDTLRYFREGYEDSFYFILGHDAFLEIETWKDYRSLFSLCHFIVMTGADLGVLPPDDQLPRVLVPDFRYAPEAPCWIHGSGHTLRFQEIHFLDISSTRIRDLLEKGQSAKYLMEAEVEGYIERNRLYRKGAGTGILDGGV